MPGPRQIMRAHDDKPLQSDTSGTYILHTRTDGIVHTRINAHIYYTYESELNASRAARFPGVRASVCVLRGIDCVPAKLLGM